MDGLIVKQPFADLIIDGKKQWELRSRPIPKNKIGSEVLLLSKGSILGRITLKKDLGSVNLQRLYETTHLHHSELDTLDKTFVTHVWEIRVTKKFDHPKKYAHPNGARVWVKNVAGLEKTAKEEITNYF